MINGILISESVAKDALHFRSEHWVVTTPLFFSGTYGFVELRSNVTGHFSYAQYDFILARTPNNVHLKRIRHVAAELSLDWLRQNYLRFTYKRRVRNDYPRPVSAY